jgi:hypothetical protein
MHHDIGAYAPGAFLLLFEHAAADADQRKHHRYLDRDRKNAQQGANRPMLQIFYYKSVDQATCRITGPRNQHVISNQP